MNTQSMVAIIGAGPAGLSMGRALDLLGIPFVIYERHSDVGGIWDRDNPGSPMYRSAHFISSKTMSGHTGFDMPQDYPDYPSNARILAYIRSFAEAFDLTRHVRFAHEVTHVAPQGDAWQVTVKHKGTTEQHVFGWVVCANGTNWVPNAPQLPGEADFDGEIMHSVGYRDDTQLRGKRVLVVGAGNSGVDIACDAARVADAAWISLRRGYHFIPKHILGDPADVFGAKSEWLPMWLRQRSFGVILRLLNGDLTRLGLAKPDHQPLSSHPIMNTQVLHYLQHGDLVAKPDITGFDGAQVRFKDGTSTEVDLIIKATGYHWHVPYLQDGLFAYQMDRPVTWLQVFNPDHPRLFINGFVETNGGAYKLFDETALLIAHAIRDQRHFPDKAEALQHRLQEAPPQVGGGVDYIASPRHQGYANSKTVLAAFADLRQEMNWPSPARFYQRATRADTARAATS